MSAEQYNKTIAALDLNQLEAAELLGVDDRTSRRWALGERDVPGPVARFLTYLLKTKRSGRDAIKTLEGRK